MQKHRIAVAFKRKKNNFTVPLIYRQALHQFGA